MTAGSFTPLNFGNNNKSHPFALGDITSISIDSLTPERVKDFRLQLFSHLQTTLEVDQIISIFHRHLKQIFPLSGIQYNNGDKMIDHQCGNITKHRANYQLTMQKTEYGEITFTRGKRFSEKELTFIESIMDVIIFPLHNALKYRDALATAMIDPLTGLNNRGAMAITLNREVERARRHDDQFVSVVMIDVDHFKDTNDRYGHLAGDDVLRQVAHCIQKAIRGSDACFRYGGEEFLVCVTNSTLGLTRCVAERIRMAIAEHVRLPDRARPVTASFGIAHYSNESDWPELVARADKALYAAKQQGRNRVVASIEPKRVDLG
ncbi:GGDEF domain-containing protein [Reinekea sp.]|jgi:diguanylate cyclase (GGDEF)-like protein|uniref:GGDEF domain-containing protein n=1 Tax=Reinekea sp. TaxID=1970455 RepID=UPI002A7FA329|nr:GGDEF domain-containing protein [Reinekea sp.]